MSSLFNFDKRIKHDGMLIGTDEAGRGPGAGGVFAAAVSFKPDAHKCSALKLLNDSKKLTEKKREMLYDVIREHSYHCVKMIDIKEIERINILQASLLAMHLAIAEVAKDSNAYVLIDGNKRIYKLNFPQQTVVKGDSKSAVIAAASILAKVERDMYMKTLHEQYPHYNWAQNKGYLTKEHSEAIKKYGPCRFHRPSFLKNIIETGDSSDITQLSL